MGLIQLSKLKLLEKIAMKSMWKKIFFWNGNCYICSVRNDCLLISISH